RATGCRKSSHRHRLRLITQWHPSGRAVSHNGLPEPTGDLHLAYQDVSGAPLRFWTRTCGCGLVITSIDVARLPLDLPLRCRCGRVRGVASDVSPSSGFRFVGYCKDCQAFARFLERPDVLAPAGGTDIFQMPPGRVKLTAGTDAVRCLRLSDKGVLRLS